MNIIETFHINTDVAIEILVPDVQHKFNYYYSQAPEQLNKFDEVTVVFKKGGDRFVILIDELQSIISPLHYWLKKAKCLPSDIVPGLIATLCNYDNYNGYWDIPAQSNIDYQQFWLWSSARYMEAWIYKYENKMYLEIGDVYRIPYAGTDLAQQDDGAFEKFMANYKPIFCGEILPEVAKDWLRKCEKIMHMIDDEHESIQS